MTPMTYSIIGIDSPTKTIGIAVASGSLGVGMRVPWVERNVGAIATQAYTNIMYGVKGLKLLRKGYPPSKVLMILLEKDLDREKRQVGVMDIFGRKAVWTGSKCPEWRGHLIGDDYIILGNLITGSEVLESMKEAFTNTTGSLLKRLLEALIAGEEAGGDRRGDRSAAIVIRGEIEITEMIYSAPQPAYKLYQQCKRKYEILF